jgi:hypothetical protein
MASPGPCLVFAARFSAFPVARARSTPPQIKAKYMICCMLRVMTEDPYFKVGYHVDRYYELEEDFLKVLKYMPLEIYNTSEAREMATSTNLADLLLRIGSNIDIVFRKMIMSKYNDIYVNKLTKINEQRIRDGKRPRNDVDLKFNDYIEMDAISKLSDYKVTVIQTGESLNPFKEWKNRGVPIWWSGYNQVKHHATLDKANLDNVIQALAALFLLICMNKHSIKMLNYGYLCINPQFKQKVLQSRRKESKHDIITKVFISPIKS